MLSETSSKSGNAWSIPSRRRLFDETKGKSTRWFQYLISIVPNFGDFFSNMDHQIYLEFVIMNAHLMDFFFLLLPFINVTSFHLYNVREIFEHCTQKGCRYSIASCRRRRLPQRKGFCHNFIFLYFFFLIIAFFSNMGGWQLKIIFINSSHRKCFFFLTLTAQECLKK